MPRNPGLLCHATPSVWHHSRLSIPLVEDVLSGRANTIHPDPNAISTSPIHACNSTCGRSSTRLIRFAINGAIRKRVVICTALICRISQNRSASASRSGNAHKPMGAVAVSLCRKMKAANPSSTEADPADTAANVRGQTPCFCTTSTPTQLAAATEAAATATPSSAPAAAYERGKSNGNTRNVPVTATIAAAKPPRISLVCSPIPRCGSRTTANSGVSENSATRVVSSIHSPHMAARTAGATNSPIPASTAFPASCPRGQRLFPIAPAVAAKTAKTPSNAA